MNKGSNTKVNETEVHIYDRAVERINSIKLGTDGYDMPVLNPKVVDQLSKLDIDPLVLIRFVDRVNRMSISLPVSELVRLSRNV